MLRLDGQTDNESASAVEGLEFKYLVGQTLHSVANGFPLL